MSQQRTLEEVQLVVNHAKLDPSELTSSCQTLSFSNDLLDLSSIRLLEADEEIVSAMCEGQVLVFRGEADDGAVLCTDSKTYDVKEAETSNSLLIVENVMIPNLEEDDCNDNRRLDSREVLGVYHRYLEIKECKPALQRIDEILSEKAVLKEKFDLDSSNLEGVTTEQLETCIQASRNELLRGLRDVDACFVHEKWWLLDIEYRCKVLNLIIKFIDENSWTLDKVFLNQTVAALREIEQEEIISQVLEQFSLAQESNNDDIRSLNKEKLSRFYGEFLLQTGSTFNLKDFLYTWENLVPEGIQVDQSHLKGIALFEENSGKSTVRYFPERKLPSGIQDRLQVLFDTKEKWTLEEITPFVETLATKKLNVNALLTKYARGSMVKGVKYFSSKHGK